MMVILSYLLITSAQRLIAANENVDKANKESPKANQESEDAKKEFFELLENPQGMNRMKMNNKAVENIMKISY